MIKLIVKVININLFFSIMIWMKSIKKIVVMAHKFLFPSLNFGLKDFGCLFQTLKTMHECTWLSCSCPHLKIESHMFKVVPFPSIEKAWERQLKKEEIKEKDETENAQIKKASKKITKKEKCCFFGSLKEEVKSQRSQNTLSLSLTQWWFLFLCLCDTTTFLSFFFFFLSFFHSHIYSIFIFMFS